VPTSFICFFQFAGIAQLVERNLAKVEVASSNLVSRSKMMKNILGFSKQWEATASHFCQSATVLAR
jgi:hypothetical protein